MARSADDISRAIRAKLRILDPDISSEPLTPERKIIDTVSEVIAEAEVDKYVLDYQFDIDSKVGADPDKFVALFGFARQAGRRATGSVTFVRSQVTDQDIVIPTGTQVVRPASTVSPASVFQTTASVTMYVGTNEVEAPIEATVMGEIGNVPAGTITTIAVTSAHSIGSAINENATTGGANEENDAELRVRFKNTVFRNIAGTRDQFLALSIASRFANKANIIGPISRFIEYVQIATETPTTGQTGAISQIPYSKYTYPFDYYLTDGDVTDELFYNPNAADFTFNSTVPPSIRVNNAVNLPTNKVVLLEHSYCSKNSRNDPANNKGNYVDIYVSGQDATNAIESAVFPGSSQNLNGTTSSPYYTGNFVRYETNQAPISGNRVQELTWQPAIGLPTQIQVGALTYTLNTHYWLLRDVTNYKGSRRARNVIEWDAAVATGITTGTEFQIIYTFDRLPLTINELIEAHKQVTTDVLVHSATERFLTVNLIVMYAPGYSKAAVDIAISTALADFLERQQFGVVIQVSDLIDVIHDVPGVDNVRLALPGDNVPYGIQEVASNGSTPIGVPHTTDFALEDSDLPVLNAVVTTQRSQNTWSG